MSTVNSFSSGGVETSTAPLSEVPHLKLINGERSRLEAPEPAYFNASNFAEICAETLDAKPKRKIGGAFLYEDTVTYLFSRTNYGKSILAFQLAYAAASGSSINGCEALRNDCPPMKVMVVDLELDNQVIGERHRAALEGMDPSLMENLLYLHEKIDRKILSGLPLLGKIEECALFYGARLIIIDNITKLILGPLRPETMTLIIEVLQLIRKKTGASILVIGHTTKINPRIAIQPVSYFGSSMIQNFFSEISYLDMTRDGKFFLCHAKTKHKECYSDTVPVFTRGEHPVTGLGFSYQSLESLADVHLPFDLKSGPVPKKRNLNQFTDEIAVLSRAGKSVARIAEMFGVAPRSIYKLMEGARAFSPVHK